jgi:serine/threonine protein kinase
MGPQIKKEISIMKIVRHNYVVGMKEVLASKTKIFIVLELVTGGELFDKIVSEGRFSEEMARFYFNQLVEGVSYCHSLGVCHRDLKPENLLLDEQGNLKISDFGLSSLYVGDADGDGASRTELLHTTCGTPNYVAPEVLADRGYEGKKADVWSIGVILYVLLAGFLPFDESTIVALFAKIQAADFTYPTWFSTEVRSLLDSILVADPKQRVTLTEVSTHPWVTHNDGARAFHPTPSLNSTVAAARVSAGVGKDDDDDDDKHESEEKPNSARAKKKLPASGGAEAAAESKKPLHKVPTEKEIEAGVQDAVGETEADSGGDSDGGADDNRAPKHLNAFDLVNQCGGFALDRVFRPRADKVTKRTFQFTSYSPPDRLFQGVLGQSLSLSLSCCLLSHPSQPLFEKWDSKLRQ